MEKRDFYFTDKTLLVLVVSWNYQKKKAEPPSTFPEEELGSSDDVRSLTRPSLGGAGTVHFWLNCSFKQQKHTSVQTHKQKYSTSKRGQKRDKCLKKKKGQIRRVVVNHLCISGSTAASGEDGVFKLTTGQLQEEPAMKS